MADLAPILREASGTYQDAGRDGVPEGRVYDMVDLVPLILKAPVRMRGGWEYVSPALPDAVDGLLYAYFKAGGKLLGAAAGNVYDIDPGGNTLIGSIQGTITNPIFHRDRVIIPPSDGITAARVVTFNGAFSIADLPASAVPGRFGTVFKDRTVLAEPNAVSGQLGFSKPGDPTVAWDALSVFNTSYALTGVAAQRNQILCFHAGSVERLRGTTPPDSTATDPTGDMQLDVLFDRAGCFDNRSIAYWGDNVIFSDARGVHITDGAIVRNMAVQGGMVTSWRRDFGEDESRGAIGSISGQVFRDIYITTIRSAVGLPITYLIDIPTRRWFRFSNIDSSTYAFSIGETEKLFATDSADKRVIDLSPCFNPDPTITQVDGNGASVLPKIETGWLRIGKTEARKRIHELYVSYIANVAGTTPAVTVEYIHDPADLTYQSLPGLKPAAEFIRRRLRVGRRVWGIGLKLTQTIATKDTRFYDIAARVEVEEETHL